LISALRFAARSGIERSLSPGRSYLRAVARLRLRLRIIRLTIRPKRRGMASRTRYRDLYPRL